MRNAQTPRSAYLSSTLADLGDERQAVKDALSGCYAVVESYEPDPQDLSRSCMGDVAACALYIGIVGLRYGFVPPGQSKSITELEFDAALVAGLPCYVFVKDAHAIAAPSTDAYTKENDPALIEAFRARLSSGASGMPRPAQFKNAGELAVKLLRALPSHAAEGEPDEASDDAPSLAAEDAALGAAQAGPAKTELQKLLWTYLQENWSTLKAQPTFTQVDLFLDLAKPAPLTAESVFDLVVRESPLDILVCVHECFEARSACGLPRWANVSEPEGIACSAIVRCALVAAERYVSAKSAASARCDHDPVASSDHLIACIEAAVCLGFGLCFSPGNRQPDNVFDLVHPVPEFGVRGEEGAALLATELLAKLQRSELQPDKDFDPDYLRSFIARRTRRLKTALVVSAYAEGSLQSAERRAQWVQDLKDEFALRSFFRQRAPDAMPPWAKQMQDTLLDALGPIFADTLKNVRNQEEAMHENDSGNAARPAGTNVTMNFNGPVGTVAQANAAGAQAAGRDIVVGVQAADLLPALAAVQRAFDECAALPHEARRSLSGELNGIREVLQSGRAPSADDGKRVKRCLDGLEKTAKALTNGQAVVNALAPIWQGVKELWPTLFN